MRDEMPDAYALVTIAARKIDDIENTFAYLMIRNPSGAPIGDADWEWLTAVRKLFNEPRPQTHPDDEQAQ